jgi:hypothetical protein
LALSYEGKVQQNIRPKEAHDKFPIWEQMCKLALSYERG